METTIEKNRVNNICMVCLKNTSAKNLLNIVIKQEGERGLTCPVCPGCCQTKMLQRIIDIPSGTKVNQQYLRKNLITKQ